MPPGADEVARDTIRAATAGASTLGIVSFDPATGAYQLRSYAQGRAGTFDFQLQADGYRWEIPAGPGAVVRFTASIQGDRWHEVGEYLAASQPPVRISEMTLTRSPGASAHAGVAEAAR